MDLRGIEPLYPGCKPGALPLSYRPIFTRSDLVRYNNKKEPMRKHPLETGYIYHILNRGVEKRKVFQKDKDYFRFIHNLYEFNDEKPAQNFYYRQSSSHSHEVGPREKKSLVDILAFCLMPNHYHLLIRQVKDNGITEFMRKLGTGYSMYFNQKNERVGPLFQGKFKSILVENERHLLFLPNYIHLNPLDLVSPEWRDGKIKNTERALNFLKRYKWSSYLDYAGEKNFPLLTSRNYLLGLSGGKNNYQKILMEWIKHPEISEISDLMLEK